MQTNGNPLYVHSLQEFTQMKEETVGGKPLVIDFTASWCPPCKFIGPIYEGLMAEHPELVMRKIDVDENNEASQEANVQCMPTFIVYRNGVEADRLEGASTDNLKALLDNASR